MRTETGLYKNKKRLSISAIPNLLLSLLICVACWLFGYNYWIGFPVGSSSGTSLLWNVVCDFFTDKDYTYLTGFTLLFLAAALLQRFNFHFVVVRGKTALPFLFFLLLNSVNPDFFPVRPVSIAIFLLLFALFELFGSFQNPTLTGRMFNIMVYLCAGSLIWPYLLWFIPIFWIGMYQFRILNTRTFLASLIGIFTVFWFVLGWCVWKHDFGVFTNIVQCISEINLFFLKESWFYEYLSPLCIFFFMIVLSVHISLQETEITIRTHNFLFFLSMLGVFSFMLSLFYTSTSVDFICVFYLLVAVIVSSFFSEKSGIVAYLLYFLLLSLLIISLFIRLWSFL